MTWSPEHSILLAKEICGYEVQTSPRGVHYIIDGENHVRPLPDFPNDPGETLTTLEAWLKVNPANRATIYTWNRSFCCEITDRSKTHGSAWLPTVSQAISHALYQALPPEDPR